MISLSKKVANLHTRENEDSASILVFGYINLNVIDGSSFFVAGLGAMLASRVGINVDILSANKIFSYNVLHELSTVDNVRVVDPYKSHATFDTNRWTTDHTLSRDEAAYAIGEMDRQRSYDQIVVRDVWTARSLVQLCPDVVSRLSVYVTGVAFSNLEVDPDIIESISVLMDSGASFILQTHEMKSTLAKALPRFDNSKHVVLGPFVPDANRDFEDSFNYNSRPSRLVYAGKFFPNWIPDKILSGFNYARIENPALSLDVAGDAFRSDSQNLSFPEEVKYLLNNSSGINWHGGLPRDRVREIVRDSDVGVSWRSDSMDFSTEFSTKVLEYGSLGKPSLLNRSQVNLQVIGDDYPLYVGSMSEYIDTLRNLGTMAGAVEEAAHRCWAVAEAHSYSRASERLLQFFDIIPQLDSNMIVLNDNDIGVAPLLEVSSRESEPIFNVSARGGRIMLRIGPSSTYSEPLGTINDSLSQLYFMQELRGRSAEAKAFDEHQNVVAGNAKSVVPVSDDTGRVSRLESDIEALRAEVDRAKNEAGQVASRLESLRASKLGKIQTWWWKKRN